MPSPKRASMLLEMLSVVVLPKAFLAGSIIAHDIYLFSILVHHIQAMPISRRRRVVARGVALLGRSYVERGLDESRPIGAVPQARGGLLALTLSGVATIAPSATA